MNFLGLRTTKSQSKYWEDRKIDWEKAYYNTWEHPHRFWITGMLSRFDWHSLFEIGVGGGANLVNILKHIKGKQVGGVDINPDAIDLCSKKFRGGVFKVGPADDLMMSDKSSDVLLADMMYIYVGPFAIGRHIKELRRVARKEIVLCELYEPKWYKRLWLYLKSGYFAHNWPKLLKKYGFYDIITIKLPKEGWPNEPGVEGLNLQQKYCYLIRAKSPKRYVQ